MKKLLATVALFVATATQAATITGFTSDYDFLAWTTSFTVPCVGCVTIHSQSQLTLYGADDPNLDPDGPGAADQFTDRFITVPVNATITFDWLYRTVDEPSYDPFGVISDDGSGILFTR
ncbi:MAG: hypothetical protein IPF94_15305 [Betaproteobacteria bacterium]|nr:hypothetical protein [Betaproteobacteria bacterium]